MCCALAWDRPISMGPQAAWQKWSASWRRSGKSGRKSGSSCAAIPVFRDELLSWCEQHVVYYVVSMAQNARLQRDRGGRRTSGGPISGERKSGADVDRVRLSHQKEPFSSAELHLATGGALGGTAPGKVARRQRYPDFACGGTNLGSDLEQL